MLQPKLSTHPATEPATGHIPEIGVKHDALNVNSLKGAEAIPGGWGNDDVVPHSDEALASPLAQDAISSDDQKYSQRS